MWAAGSTGSQSFWGGPVSFGFQRNPIGWMNSALCVPSRACPLRLRFLVPVEHLRWAGGWVRCSKGRMEKKRPAKQTAAKRLRVAQDSTVVYATQEGREVWEGRLHSIPNAVEVKGKDSWEVEIGLSNLTSEPCCRMVRVEATLQYMKSSNRQKGN